MSAPPRLDAAHLTFDRPTGLEATAPPERRGVGRDRVRMLVTRAGRHTHASFTDLPYQLDPGDLLVVNESATLPASLPACGADGPFLLNLSTRYGPHLWLAEPRRDPVTPGPLPFRPGDAVLAAGLPARMVAPFPDAPRLWFVELAGDVAEAMRRHGQPIRYGYLRPPHPPLSAYQTMFARVPGSAEMPSAARPFTPGVVGVLRRRGIAITRVLLHTGVSSREVDEPSLDEHPLAPEPFRVTEATAQAVNAARARGNRVVAAGTTVVRALESAVHGGAARPAAGFTRLLLRPERPPRLVDGLLTGLHDSRTTHLALLYSLEGEETVRSAYAAAIADGYLWHEFGDTHLLLHH